MLPGMLYLVSIRMVPLVPRGPVGKVYGDVPEACKPLFGFKRKRWGKGLSTQGQIALLNSTLSSRVYNTSDSYSTQR